jgi:hypothetical protein
MLAGATAVISTGSARATDTQPESTSAAAM